MVCVPATQSCGPRLKKAMGRSTMGVTVHQLMVTYKKNWLAGFEPQFTNACPSHLPTGHKVFLDRTTKGRAQGRVGRTAHEAQCCSVLMRVPGTITELPGLRFFLCQPGEQSLPHKVRRIREPKYMKDDGVKVIRYVNELM